MGGKIGDGVIGKVNVMSIVKEGHASRITQKTIGMVGRIFGNNLLWGKEMNVKTRNVDGMEAHGYRFVKVI